jgi:pimeloyl-ACP methyl ester carboxylesterase
MGAEARTAAPTGLETDFLKDQGGEAAIKPTAGMTQKRPDGSIATWREYTSPRDRIDLREVFAGRPVENVVAYAFTTIKRSQAGQALLAAGSDDGVRMWLNGKLVHHHAIRRGLRADEDLVPVTFRAGENDLLVKVEQGLGDWGLCVRVPDPGEAKLLTGQGLGSAIVRGEGAEAGKLVVLTSQMPGGAPAAVKVEVVAPGGRVVASAEAPRGERAALDSAAWSEGPYEIVCRSAAPDGRELIEYLSWYKGDALAEARRLVSSAPQADPSTSVGMVHAMLAEMVLSKLDGKLAGASAEQLTGIYGVLMEFAEVQQAASGGPGGLHASGMVRLAYRDEVDDSPQFCRAYLPPDYSPEKKWPMIVNLHGYNGPNPRYVGWWGSDQRHDRWADRYHVIMIYPHGRGNTWYRGIGDRDVIKCIELAKQAFSVDDDRVYLTGYSMGGGGTWHIGTRHPELFAALGPYYGGWDYHVDMPAQRIEKLTPWERSQAERESSFAQAEQLLNLPTWVMHGDSDPVVSAEQSRYAVRMLQRWGYDIRYQEVPGLGHEDLRTEDGLYPWFLSHKRDPDPRRVRIRAPELKSASAYWVQIGQQENPFAFIHAEAEVVGPNEIRLDTENALEVILSPGPPLVDTGRPLRVVWNGEAAREVRLDGRGRAALRARSYNPKGPVKTPGLEGPISDFQTTPFAVVIGTASADPMMRRLCEQQGRNWAKSWESWQHWAPRVFKDSEISDADVQRYSLLLVGGPEANLVTRRLIGKLPVRLSADAITLDDRAFPARDAALTMIYPHPLNRDRYVILDAATSPAGMYFADRMPSNVDFCVSDGRIANSDEGRPAEKVFVAMGRFDHTWRLNPAFLMAGEAAARSQSPTRRPPKEASAVVTGDRLMVSDLLESRAEGAFSMMVRDLNWVGKPITLGGKSYASGIGTNTDFEPNGVEFDLAGGEWKRLRGVVGIELRPEEKTEKPERDSTRVVFVVLGDSKELYRSQPFTWASATPRELDVDVSGVKLLRLEVVAQTSPMDAVQSADWAELRLER